MKKNFGFKFLKISKNFKNKKKLQPLLPAGNTHDGHSHFCFDLEGSLPLHLRLHLPTPQVITSEAASEPAPAAVRWDLPPAALRLEAAFTARVHSLLHGNLLHGNLPYNGGVVPGHEVDEIAPKRVLRRSLEDFVAEIFLLSDSLSAGGSFVRVLLLLFYLKVKSPVLSPR